MEEYEVLSPHEHAIEDAAENRRDTSIKELH